MANREVAVSMRDITKVFGTVKANNKVNLDIYRGEILSLLGENGSGKTTLMNMLSGIYYPDGGEVYINGELANECTTLRGKGHIALQSEGGPIEFRNITLSEL